jgi:hypothetical protein
LDFLSGALSHRRRRGRAEHRQSAKKNGTIVLDSPKHSGRGAKSISSSSDTPPTIDIDKTSACLSASHSSSNVRLRRLDLPGFDRETTMVRLPRLFSRRAPRGGAARAAPSARRARHRAASPFRDRASVRSPAHSISPAQALTLYTKDADGSVKAVIAAKAGGLDLTVLPIAQYTGSADASQVRIAAIGSPKPRRGNPETLRTRPRAPFVARNPKRSAPFSRDANASRIKTHPAHLSHHPPS